ncbi:hypothetical protein HPP92_028348, partial [Vanilla planifolia]
QMGSPLAITNASDVVMACFVGVSIETNHNNNFSKGDIHLGSKHHVDKRCSAPRANQQIV